MNEKINKILSSKILLILLVLLDYIFSFSYTISGAVTFGQHLAFMLGGAVMIFIIFAISQSITKKSSIYKLNLAIIIYWILYLFVIPFIRGFFR